MHFPLKFPEVSGEILLDFLDGVTGGKCTAWPMANEKVCAWEIIILEHLPLSYN